MSTPPRPLPMPGGYLARGSMVARRIQIFSESAGGCRIDGGFADRIGKRICEMESRRLTPGSGPISKPFLPFWQGSRVGGGATEG